MFIDDVEKTSKEDEEIKKDIWKMKMKKKIAEKMKMVDVNQNRGIDTTSLEEEIENLKEEYENKKKVVDHKVKLQINNTEEFFDKQRLLNQYFRGHENAAYPRFTVENEKNIKGKEIIAFRPLHKEELVRRMYDKCPCLKTRKQIYKWYTNAKYYCNFIVDNNYFAYFSLLIVILNTIVILIHDGNDDNSLMDKTEIFFLIFYSIEAILKILGYGFFLGDRAYAKDYWNMLDLLIICVGWVSFLLEQAIKNKHSTVLVAFNAIRVLRPLKTVKTIKGLRRLMIALLASVSKLSDITILLFFFFLIFAIAGMQMWQGLFQRRCMNLSFGYMYSYVGDTAMCTYDEDCEEFNEPGRKYICVKGYLNPNNNAISFDNVLNSFITVFVIVSQEGWTNIFAYVMKTFKDKFYINRAIIFIYFHILVFVGGMYLINLFLALTNSEFTSIEKKRVELTQKKNFVRFLKSRYDLREKEKQEKKKKEKQLKEIAMKKNEGSLSNLKNKIKREAFHIRKHKEDIPVNYTTIKDMYIFQNNNPEELYQIDKMINEEEEYLCKDIKKQIANIDQMLAQRKLEANSSKPTEASHSRQSSFFSKRSSESHDNNNPLKRKKTQTVYNTNPNMKIYSSIISFAIYHTHKFLKERMSNYQKAEVKKKKPDTANLLRQKIEKKEIEKFNANQITVFDDLPFETELKEKQKKEELKRKKDAIRQKATFGKRDSIYTELNYTRYVPEIHIKNPTEKKINEELSFMTDLSLSNDEFNQKTSEQQPKENNYLVLNENTNFSFNENEVNNFTNNSTFSDTSSIIINKPKECVQRKYLLNHENRIFLKSATEKPHSFLPDLLKLKNDREVQEKLEKMREKFNLERFLERNITIEESENVNGRRHSYLNFLQNIQDKRNYNEIFKGIGNDELNESKLDVSIYKKDQDISISSDQSLSGASNISSFHLYEKCVPDENLDSSKLSGIKKTEKKNYAEFAHKWIFDKNAINKTHFLNSNQVKTFYGIVNQNMNDNINLDMKLPRGRDGDKSMVSHQNIMNDFSFSEDAEEEAKREKQRLLNLSFKERKPYRIESKRKSEKNVYFYKSKSIDKNIMKYPIQNSNDLIVEEVNKKMTTALTPQQEQISENWRSRKFYMNYLNNIKDKDLKVKDNFPIDHWKDDILGMENPQIERKPIPEYREGEFVFNKIDLKLKKYKYFKYKNYVFTNEECAELSHNLKNLPINVLEIMPPRIRNFGIYAVGKEVQLGVLESKALPKLDTSASTKLTNKAPDTSLQKTKTNLTAGSAFTDLELLQFERKYKKGLYEKIYRKVSNFNYRTLSHYFLDDETIYYKLADWNHRDERNQAIKEYSNMKQHVVEVKSTVNDIRIFDIQTNSCRYVHWSGEDVLYTKQFNEDNFDKYNAMINTLENFGVIIWNRTPFVNVLQRIRYGLYKISTSSIFDYFIILIVLSNTVILALDGNIFSPETTDIINRTNYYFNAVFIAEFLIKFVGLGPIVYFSDAFTFLDLFIIIFAIVDMTQEEPPTKNEININSKASIINVFKIFRVLRIAKILRKLKSMRVIIYSIKRSLANLSYIVIILLMVLFIFQLLGMTILNGNVRYQSFLIAFYTTFQILTTKNWNSILYELYPLNHYVFLYYLVWIFLGNYILFNLFISILLQSFDDEPNEEEDEDTKIDEEYELPDYLAKLKQIESDHKSSLKKQKKKGWASATLSGEGSKTSYNRFSGHEGEEESSQNYDIIQPEDEDEEEKHYNIISKIDKNMKNWQQINSIFRNNECENSLYLFSQINQLRVVCMKIATNKVFDFFILAMIMLSTIRLILNTFIEGYISIFVFDMADLIFNIVFLFEMIIKIIALGMIIDEGSYLRDNWNKIDLAISLVSLIDIQSIIDKYINNNGSTSSNSFLQILRLLRTLRPLRFISHNIQLKMIITSLFDSILPIANALFIVIMVFLIFSIVGMKLFYNLFHNCFIRGKDIAFQLADSDFANYLDMFHVTNSMPAIQQFCSDRYNGIMDAGPKFKYTNIFTALITNYALGVMVSWSDIMNDYRMFNDYYGLFFVIYILIVSYFFLNLFTAIMFKYFNDAWTKERKVDENDKKAEKYYDFLQQITLAEPEYKMYIFLKKGSFRYYLMKIASSKGLENVINVVIFFNMISMGITYDGSTSKYQWVLDILNYIFTGIFTLEFLIKIIGLGVYRYFHHGWNGFDCFLVVTSIIDLIIGSLNDITSAFLKTFQLIRVLRVLRVLRLIRLFRTLKSLEKLLQTLKWSVSALSNVFLLMFLVYCIFAILGCYLYEKITYKKYGSQFSYLSQFYNFDNFYYSFLLCFRATTGEDWPSIMLELAFIDQDEVSETQAYVYMIMMNFFNYIIILNLFLMVTLQQYDQFTNKSYNPLELFEEFLNTFRIAWNKYSNKKDNGYRIPKLLIVNFFSDLTWKKLNFPEENKLEYIKKYVSDLKLRNDQENFVYFHDVLFKIIVKQMGSRVDKTLPENMVLIKEEKKVANAVTRKINRYIIEHELYKNKLTNPLHTFNPLTSHLYFKISYLYFKTFISYYRENAQYFQNDNFSADSSADNSFTRAENKEEREEILINHSMENNNEDNGSDISNHTIKILDNFLIINESTTNRNLLEGTILNNTNLNEGRDTSKFLVK